MKARLRVESTDGETVVVSAAVADFIRWERQYKRKSSELVAAWALEDWAYIAWAALRRGKGTALTFDEWQQTVSAVELADEESAVPTQPGASTVSS